METVRLDMASITPIMPDVVRPDYINSPFTENKVSKWIDLENELSYYMEDAECIEGITCFDRLVL